MSHRPLSTPSAEVTIDARLVAELLEDQHPDLALLPLHPLEQGWDNVMFRLGSELTMRLPRRSIAADLIEREQRWLPVLAPRLPLPIPAPVRSGLPGRGYPWCWSVLPWLAGAPADIDPPAPAEAERLAALLRSLWTTPPEDAPTNSVRGVPLASRRAIVEGRLARLAAVTQCITDRIVLAWRSALAADATYTRCWVHGDLHPRNVLVRRGVITGIIDWGDLCAGDPATDLAAVWMLLGDRDARRRAIQSCGMAGVADWHRALGWAVSFGTVMLETGLADHPRNAALGRNILRRIDEGPGPGDVV